MNCNKGISQSLQHRYTIKGKSYIIHTFATARGMWFWKIVYHGGIEEEWKIGRLEGWNIQFPIFIDQCCDYV